MRQTHPVSSSVTPMQIDLRAILRNRCPRAAWAADELWCVLGAALARRCELTERVAALLHGSEVFTLTLFVHAHGHPLPGVGA